MIKNCTITLLFFGYATMVVAQEADSTINDLDEAVISTFVHKEIHQRDFARTISLEKNLMHHPERLLELVNLAPGVRMEERSPNSYRLNIRGSAIRSPFGIRNVKIYLNDFILTDPSGNTYLNLVEPGFIQGMDLFYSAQGGQYGATSGGVILMETFKEKGLMLDAAVGSYGLLSQQLKWSVQLGQHQLQIGQSYYQSNGYRDQSASQKKSLFLHDQWQYSENKKLNIMLLYTDLHYETPGGLTLDQMQANRRSARWATNTLPSAVTQRAGIYNNTLLVGVGHQWKINKYWSHYIGVQYAHTDFENPFITNYEIRKEQQFQWRTHLTYDKKWNHIHSKTSIGAEWGIQQLHMNNYENLAGYPSANAFRSEENRLHSGYLFVSQWFEIHRKLVIDARINLNTQGIQNQISVPSTSQQTFGNQLMALPTIGVNYLLKKNWYVRAMISKGLSYPTLEEFASYSPMNQRNLRAEYGWNKEVGIRKSYKNLKLDFNIFHFKLSDAIIKQQDLLGNDYFINVGHTIQRGAEISLELIHNNTGKFFSAILNKFSAHAYNFKYQDLEQYHAAINNKFLPGIPKYGINHNISTKIGSYIRLFINHFYQSSMYLNDQNTIKEQGFIIGNTGLEGTVTLKKLQIKPYISCYNIYNTHYSSGYDINAFGNRYYNPSPLRNYVFGVKFHYK